MGKVLSVLRLSVLGTKNREKGGTLGKIHNPNRRITGHYLGNPLTQCSKSSKFTKVAKRAFKTS